MNFVILFLLSFTLIAKDPSTVWGKIIKSDQTVKNITYKYFVTFEENGKFHAYPVETSDKKLATQIIGNVDKLVRIKGGIKTVKVAIDGKPQEIPVFTPESISPLTLSDLSVDYKPDFQNKPSSLNPDKEPYNGGGIRINDTLANTLIITGGALMIGSALLKSINKK